MVAWKLRSWNPKNDILILQVYMSYVVSVFHECLVNCWYEDSAWFHIGIQSFRDLSNWKPFVSYLFMSRTPLQPTSTNQLCLACM